ncbi:MAG: hypothetical protein HRU69_03635 [Flammeovirgaceae bacterium]|nr:MAG: hypothetical protein HRU69_03635 [Flammeovirgaceae bacterium]
MKWFKTIPVLFLNLAALSMLVYFSGCCWKTPEDKSYRLEVTQKHLLPYTDSQVIQFENDEGEQFPVTVSKQFEIIKLAMEDAGCVECCYYYETLELEITRFSTAGPDSVFPVLVAAPLKSTPNKLKDGSFVLKVITADALEYLLSGSGSLLRTELALSFDDSRELICVSDEPFRFCQPVFEINGVPFEYVAGVRLTSALNQNFSFLDCFFNNSGLLSIRQIIYDNNQPVDTINYYRVN